MNGGQKAVLCVGLGAVAVVVGLAARAWWWGASAGGAGWFNYAPNNGAVFAPDQPDGGAIVAQALVWIALVAAWTAACLYVLRTEHPEGVGPVAEHRPGP